MHVLITPSSAVAINFLATAMMALEIGVEIGCEALQQLALHATSCPSESRVPQAKGTGCHA